MPGRETPIILVSRRISSMTFVAVSLLLVVSLGVCTVLARVALAQFLRVMLTPRGSTEPTHP